MSREDIKDAKELIAISKEYILGLKMELARKELASTGKDPVKQVELAAYFTHCSVQPGHLKLSNY